MEFSIPLPAEFAHDSSIGKQWAEFVQRFSNHCKASQGDDSVPGHSSILLFAAQQKMDMINAYLNDKNIDLSVAVSVLEIVETVCLPNFLLLFERFRYFSCEQTMCNSVEEFFGKLQRQVDLCQFGVVQESALTNSLISNVSGKLKETHKKKTGLSFDDAIDVCQSDLKKNVKKKKAKTAVLQPSSSVGTISTRRRAFKDKASEIVQEDADEDLNLDVLNNYLKEGLSDDVNNDLDDNNDDLDDNNDDLDDNNDDLDDVLNNDLDDVLNNDHNNDLINDLDGNLNKYLNDINVGLNDDEDLKSIQSETTQPPEANQKTPTGSLKQKSIACFGCQKDFRYYRSFCKHVLKDHPTIVATGFYCIHCDMKFENSKDCFDHCVSHIKKIEIVEQGTKKRRRRRKSKKKVDGPYICSICGDEQADIAEYNKHCRSHHLTDVRVYNCNMCQRRTHTIARMIGHLKGHLAGKLKCEVCGVLFATQEFLETHRQTHVDGPKHECQICSKVYVSKYRLKKHMLVHSCEKSYTCEHCGKMFAQKYSFEYHLRWHKGEKPYECDICGHRTTGFGDLRRHKEYHSEKRHVCEVCGKAFRFVYLLNKHHKQGSCSALKFKGSLDDP